MHPKNNLQNRRTSTHTPADATAAAPLMVGYAELIRMLSVSRRHVQRMVERGELPRPRASGMRRLFVLEEVLQAIEKLPTP
jgi:excisionase family DNA binding protein